MKFYASNTVPIILTLALCLTSLNANAITSKQADSPALSALTIAPTSPDTFSKFINFNQPENSNQSLNSMFASSETSLNFDNHSSSAVNDITVNIPAADLNFGNQSLAQGFKIDPYSANNIEELNFRNERERYERIEHVTSPVPENSESVLLMCGLMLLLFEAKRRKLCLNFTAA